METRPAHASGAATTRRRLPDHRELKRLSRLGAARSFIGFACALSLLMSGYSRPGEQSADVPATVTIQHEILPQPARVGAAAITLKLTDAAGKPVTGAHITIEADMTHPGMTPSFADAKETESGRYQAHLQFPMAGDWVILLHVTLPNGRNLEQQFDVKGVRPN